MIAKKDFSKPKIVKLSKQNNIPDEHFGCDCSMCRDYKKRGLKTKND